MKITFNDLLKKAKNHPLVAVVSVFVAFVGLISAIITIHDEIRNQHYKDEAILKCKNFSKFVSLFDFNVNNQFDSCNKVFNYYSEEQINHIENLCDKEYEKSKSKYNDCNLKFEESSRKLANLNEKLTFYNSNHLYKSALEYISLFDYLDVFDIKKAGDKYSNYVKSRAEAYSLRSNIDATIAELGELLSSFEDKHTSELILKIREKLNKVYNQPLNFSNADLNSKQSKIIDKAEKIIENSFKVKYEKTGPIDRPISIAAPEKQPLELTSEKNNNIAPKYYALTNTDLLSQPFVGSSVVISIQGGDKLQILSEKGRWVEVKTLSSGHQGFLKHEFVGEINNK